jgi:UDP-N-acetyl-D-glucosamine dehydrogenase
MTHLNELRGRIQRREACVAVLGLGYVGLPLVRAFTRAGLPTIGYDIDQKKIDALNAGRDYLQHPAPGLARELLHSGRFGATSDPADLAHADALLVCVPTPLDERREPDLSYVERTIEAIAGVAPPGRLVVLESTTYPGTTRDVVLPRLERAGRRLGEDLFVAFSPEREDPGSPGRSTRSIPKLVGGLDEPSTRVACELYRTAIATVVPVSSAEVAEAAKLLENVYRSVNIALVNEMKLILEKLGIDPLEVIDAAATKPFGFQRFDPGPGLGGHCIPIDPYYLAWRARRAGIDARFVELAGEINCAMPAHVVDRLGEALRRRGSALDGADVIVLGLAYKKNIDDVRESPSAEIIRLLRAAGARVCYSDPHIARTHPGRKGDLAMESVELTPERLEAADAVIIATDHDAFDWGRIAEHAGLIVDTRGRMRRVEGVRGEVVSA